MIPKIIHRIWIGNSEMPPEFQFFWRTWRHFHPDWKFFDWNDSNIQDLSLHSLIAKVRVPAAAADIARYELLYRYGGVYVDCDLECKKNIEELIQDATFVVCNENDNFGCLCSNSFFAVEKEHKILKRAINELSETDINVINESSPAAVTGPYFFRRIINNDRVKVLPTETLYPYMHFKRDYYRFNPNKIYAIHHWHNSWLPLDSLKWLAEQQLLNGDYLSCLETCQKTNYRFGADNQISLIKSKSNQAILQRKAILKMLKRPLLAPMLAYSQDLAISQILVEEESQANSSRGNLRASWRKFVKRINRKIINSNFFKVHSKHLLDYVFVNGSANKVALFGTPKESLLSDLNLYVEKHENITVTLFDSIEDELSIAQCDILQVYVDDYDEVLLSKLLNWFSPKIILLEFFEKFSKEKGRILRSLVLPLTW